MKIVEVHNSNQINFKIANTMTHFPWVNTWEIMNIRLSNHVVRSIEDEVGENS